MSRRGMLVLLSALAVSLICYERVARTRYSHAMAEALAVIHRDYVDPVDDRALFEGAVSGMIDTLDDPYSAYLSPEDSTSLHETLEQKFGGIGIVIHVDRQTKAISVATPVPGTPAFRAGIRAGDRLIRIDGVPAQDLAVDEAMRRLRGPAGSKVTLTVQRPGQDEPKSFELVREPIRVDSVTGDRRREDGSWDFALSGQPGIGYVRISQFGVKTPVELREALEGLQTAGIERVVIDLRGNPGGSLEAAQDASALFLSAGELVVRTVSRGERFESRLVAEGDGPFRKMKLAVLINGDSASASEILAACLQDHHRATIVGERSFGKGTVQELIPLSQDRSGLRLTIRRYWRPSNKNIHRAPGAKETDDWGVQPDPGNRVPLTDSQAEALGRYLQARDVATSEGETFTPAAPRDLAVDPQLQRAVEVLREE